MKKKIFFFSLLIAGAIFLLSVQYQSKQVKLECPREAKAVTSNLVLPFDRIPALKATLEISGNGSNRAPQDIGVQLVPKQASRSNSPRLIQLSQIQLSDVPAGNYHLKVTLKRADDNLVLATLDLDPTIQPGTSIDFGQVAWNYDVDDDRDNFNNITEIMNGSFQIPQGGTIPNVWTYNPTNFRDIAEFPHNDTLPPTPKIVLLRPWAISLMAPDSNGRINIIGDPFSVPSGVWVKADLLGSGGIQKNTTGAFSRIDGSFDLNFPSGVVAEDKILVYVISRKVLERGDLKYNSSTSQSMPTSSLELPVRNFQNCL